MTNESVFKYAPLCVNDIFFVGAYNSNVYKQPNNTAFCIAWRHCFLRYAYYSKAKAFGYCLLYTAFYTYINH